MSNGRTLRLGDSQPGPEGLALAVITLGILDATTTQPGQPRDAARHWLAEGESLPFWCAIAGVDPSWLRSQLARAGITER